MCGAESGGAWHSFLSPPNSGVTWDSCDSNPNHYSMDDVLSIWKSSRDPAPGLAFSWSQASSAWHAPGSRLLGKAGLSIDHILVQVVRAQGSPLSSSGNSKGLPKSLGHSREPACQAGFSASTWLGLYPSFVQGSHLKCDSERVSESQKHPDWRGNILGTDGLRFSGGLPRNLAGALFRQPTSRSRAVDRKRQKAPVLAFVSAMTFLPVTTSARQPWCGWQAHLCPLSGLLAAITEGALQMQSCVVSSRPSRGSGANPKALTCRGRVHWRMALVTVSQGH